MATGQPRVQTAFIPGQKEPADLVHEHGPSQSSDLKNHGKFGSFFGSGKTEPSGNERNGEGPEDGKQQGDLYAPVSTKFVNKKVSNKTPSSELDGPKEGAEMNDLYSPQSAVDLETSGKQTAPEYEKTKHAAADTDEHEQRGEDSGTIISGPGLVEASKGMANEVSETLVQLRGRVMEKLSALQLPSESLDAARKTFETGLKGAYTTTVDAVQRTKQSLLDILPSSLSSSNATEARKVVEDMEQELLCNAEGSGEDQTQVAPEGLKANLAALPTSATVSRPLQSKL